MKLPRIQAAFDKLQGDPEAIELIRKRVEQLEEALYEKKIGLKFVGSETIYLIHLKDGDVVTLDAMAPRKKIVYIQEKGMK